MTARQELDALLARRPELAALLLGAAQELEQAPQKPVAERSFRDIESLSHRVGRRVSKDLTEAQLREFLATLPEDHPCPDCGRMCKAKPDKRTMQTVDGPVDVPEVKCHCRRCRRDFFPGASETRTGSLGL